MRTIRFSIAIAFGLMVSTVCHAKGHKAPEGPAVPDHYKLLYSQDFDGEEALSDFVFSDPEAWQLEEGVEGSALGHYQDSDYSPPHRSPRNIALIAKRKFSDFVLEAKLQQTGREYGHRDLCLFYGFQDPAHYYYTHIAATTDEHAHNCFIVNEAPRTKISHKTTEGIDWGENVWHTVRIERDTAKGTIKVYFNDLEEPIMEAKDKHFKKGYIGFGSFDDVGKIDNIRIWGPTPYQRPDFFESK